MRFVLTIMISLMLTSCNRAADLVLVSKGHSAYTIIIPAEATANEKKAAGILQQYIQQLSGLRLPIQPESVSATSKSPSIYVGNTEKAQSFQVGSVNGEGYLLTRQDNNLVLYGRHGQGVVYAVYAFIEKYFHLFKGAGEPVFITPVRDLVVTGFTPAISNPAFIYRQAYFPASQDAEYLSWHKLQQFEDLWGIWGHSYFKLVDSAIYFKTHPEYFSAIDSIRQPVQLCMSNEKVVEIAIAALKKRMEKFPDAEYWSVSANDNINYCTCEKCRAIQKEEGSASGAHLRFVNRIAAAFPDKKITTLAYQYTAEPPAKTKPLPNVFIMLSTIDAYRSAPLVQEASARLFMEQIKGWRKLTGNLMLWDYNTQFTNYLSPFPDLFFLADNIRFYQSLGVKGLFSQGSGESYSDLAELRSYLLAKLSWDPQADWRQLIETFCSQYYGAAAPFIRSYIDQLQEAAQHSGRPIDIYGNPVWEYNTYLSPEKIDAYSTILDKAAAAVENDTLKKARVERVRLSLEYTVLQQSRFFGPEKHGYLELLPNKSGYRVKALWPGKVERFGAAATRAGVKELSEGGLSPDAYGQEWQGLFEKGWQPNLALHAAVKLATPFAPEYTNKGPLTLVDGVTGNHDFSYNWLCFYGQDMIATIDMGETKTVSNIHAAFLDDPKHHIFLPASLQVEVSADGSRYEAVQSTYMNQLGGALEEHYNIHRIVFDFSVPETRIRYIRFSAKNHASLPKWRYHPNKKPMIACDEIYVL